MSATHEGNVQDKVTTSKPELTLPSKDEGGGDDTAQTSGVKDKECEDRSQGDKPTDHNEKQISSAKTTKQQQPETKSDVKESSLETDSEMLSDNEDRLVIDTNQKNDSRGMSPDELQKESKRKESERQAEVDKKVGAGMEDAKHRKVEEKEGKKRKAHEEDEQSSSKKKKHSDERLLVDEK